MDNINIVSDLLALNTRYHPLCYKTMDNTVKRNFDKDDNNCFNSNRVDIINKIFCFLNTHEQKVYSLKDILSSELHLAEFSNYEMRDLVPMLKRRLNGVEKESSVFHFLKFCSLAFCPGFNLLYTAEIRGQPLVLLYKMILSVCVHCACWPEKTAGPICKIFSGSYRFEYGDCQKNSNILYKLIN